MYTRNHHKRTVQSGGVALNGKIILSLMAKGERFIRCRGQRHGSTGRQIYQMQRIEENLLDTEDRGMVPRGS
jgi:hypothetical protein